MHPRPERFASAAAFVAALLVFVGCGAPSSGASDASPGGPVAPGTPGDPNDKDGDGFTPSEGDCNDADATIYPGARELCDHKDNNCNGVVDEGCDGDGDGYVLGGMPADCDDGDPLVNPGAFEVVGNMVDDDCDGVVDEVEPACDASPMQPDAVRFAGAIGLCAPWVIGGSTNFNPTSDEAQRKVLPDYGTFYKPKEGASFVVLSSGIAADEDDAAFARPQDGTAFSHPDQPNPLRMNVANNVCGKSTHDELMVHDVVEWTIALKVPTNARSLSFKFNFLSAEYPEWVGSDFNDKFLVLLDSKAYAGNISFDSNKNPITVNVGFFDACDTELICDGARLNQCAPNKVGELDGTGYELPVSGGLKAGGSTGWLTTTAPVSPGENATLRFIIFDEGDHKLDSAVLIDDFQWQLKAADGPKTIQ